jgi:glycosyltransferase involved in cell wall biosynthesis
VPFPYSFEQHLDSPCFSAYNGAMRIVFVGPFAVQPKRTMAVRALPLAKALASRGHDVLLLLPPWDSPQDDGREWLDEGVSVHNVRLPPPVPLLRHLLLTWRLLRAALRHQPDVIHCFKPKSYAGLTAWVVWQLKRWGWLRVRLVVDADDWEGAGGWNELERYTWLQKQFFAWQERWGLTHNDALTVASRALQTIAWSLGVPKEKVYYLPNGWWPGDNAPAALDAAELRREYGLGDGPVAMLYTRFFEYCLERAMEIIEGVLTRMPEARWLIVGKGLFGEEDRFMSMAKSRGLAQQITYLGWVEPGLLRAYFELPGVAIYPFDDTLINRCKCAVKLIDLLAAGVPVVADAVGQNAEYIQDGTSGILVTPGDKESFVASVVRLLGDPDLGRSLGRAAQERMHSEFAWYGLVERAERAYER